MAEFFKKLAQKKQQVQTGMISVGPVSVRAKDVAEKTQLLLTSGLFKEIAKAYEVALRVLLIFERAGSAT